jgi:hypothetical protein
MDRKSRAVEKKVNAVRREMQLISDGLSERLKESEHERKLLGAAVDSLSKQNAELQMLNRIQDERIGKLIQALAYAQRK